MATTRPKAYDPKCDALAGYFLVGAVYRGLHTPEYRERLAQAIQETVEDELRAIEADAEAKSEGAADLSEEGRSTR